MAAGRPEVCRLGWLGSSAKLPAAQRPSFFTVNSQPNIRRTSPVTSRNEFRHFLLAYFTRASEESFPDKLHERNCLQRSYLLLSILHSSSSLRWDHESQG